MLFLANMCESHLYQTIDYKSISFYTREGCQPRIMLDYKHATQAFIDVDKFHHMQVRHYNLT